MIPPDPPAWEALLRDAAGRAEEALGRLAAEAWAAETGWGADGTITAGADKAAEDALLGFLADAIPEASLCSEEAGVTEGASDVLLIVDPVDGTNNAVRGVPYWGISLGVVVGGEPVGGFVRNVPARDDLFAWAGHGATRNGRPVRPTDVTRMQDACVAVQRPVGPDAYEAARGVLLGTKVLRVLGASAVDVALVGAGALDAYVNVNTNPMLPFGDKVVDYAAGAVIARVAGAAVSDATGAPLRYDTDLLARTPVVAAATPALHEEILRALGASGAGDG